MFAHGWSADRLIDSLEANAWRGAIIGPHGSGKSSLLASLLPELEKRGIRPHLISLHDGQRWLPRTGRSQSDETRESRRGPTQPRVLWVIDGYEQLNRFSRWLVALRCRRRGWGLLVTAHHTVSLPTIFAASPSLAILQAIVDRLLPSGVTTLTPVEAAEAYSRAGGNLREALFCLYDRYQQWAN